MSELAQHTETDPFTSSLAGRRLGRYEVLARLATGGMASVYVARALGVAGFERLFAVKVLHPHLAHEEEFITMFLDEARLAARIRHPNVVPTTDISDTADAGYYLVMDYIEGDHLGALLQHAFRAHGRIPAPIVLRIIVDALQGLGAAHALTNEHGEPLHLVHRDVSPHNVMVSTDGVARITDFGVAKASVRLSTTQEGQFKGKLAYMAPEHASNGQSDQRSDLFAMSIILWESLTGRRLFRAENHAATLNKICLEPIPMPSEVDPALAPFDPILQRGLARNPAERFQTAEEFAEAIEAHADSLGGMANQRTVARLVREYAADKLDRDRNLIRTAIQELGRHSTPPMGASHSGVAPRPQDPRATEQVTLEAPSVDLPETVLVGSEELEVALSEAAIADQDRRKRPIGLWLGIALALAAVGVGTTTALWSDGPKQPESAPLDEQPQATSQPGLEEERATPTERAGAPGELETETSAATNPVAAPTGEAEDDELGDEEAVPAREAHGTAGLSRPAARERFDGARASDEPSHQIGSRAGTRDTRRKRPGSISPPVEREPTARERPVVEPPAPAAPRPRAKSQDLPPEIEDDLMLNPYR